MDTSVRETGTLKRRGAWMASASMAILINLLHVYRYMLSLNPINDPFVVVHLPARDSVGRSVGSVRLSRGSRFVREGAVAHRVLHRPEPARRPHPHERPTENHLFRHRPVIPAIRAVHRVVAL